MRAVHVVVVVFMVLHSVRCADLELEWTRVVGNHKNGPRRGGQGIYSK